MVSSSRFIRAFSVVVVFTCLAGLAGASPIVSRTEGFNDSISLINQQAVSWSYDSNLSNVLIDVFGLRNNGVDDATLVLSLYKNQLDGDFVDSTTVALPSLSTIGYTWTLGAPLTAGTYFLQLYACKSDICTPDADEAFWLNGGNTTNPAAPGASYGTEYWNDGTDWIPTDSGVGTDGQLGGYQVSGEVPEPATWLLLGTGLIGAGLIRRRRA